ncbi:Chemotaxis protein methyltransferase Cher2 [Pigmentiphaga humi]|uniref:Chemotaxis protein methyltransferase Cher2 n=1 Tax=Pigmentiphaga humi TaxID=2478468 RepID=A0A3P4B764_9BURK|nr:protein-glutamate O-methyltransferase CheR [Pigmentiphaga humi]VCU72123.1 Chemotaxis protein methyltransferase Cher2 [Pigmentiphaga humi]
MDPDLDEIELDFFIEAMRSRHGYDLGRYARASLKRRVRGLVAQHGFEHIGALASRVLRDAAFLPRVIEGLSVPVSEMFRDPHVFAALRTLVFPTLASYPHINIWQAGCAHGEEMYSLAILLEEAGLYDRCQIYATDFSDAALARAREGVFSTREARTASLRYQQAGGSRTLADYYHARYDLVKLDDGLRRNVIFANHNLATDGVFCEAHLILCRNVLIYFNDALQDHVLSLFANCLVRGGYLCLGTKENLSLAPAAAHFIDVDRNARIFRSVRTG